MTSPEEEEIEERSETALEESTPIISRAQSNYSTQRTKLTIAPIKYGETRPQYLWRLLRSSIRRTIEAVSRADDADIERSHGLHFVRNVNHDIPVLCLSFNVKQKEIISVDHKHNIRIYHSDGRLRKKFRSDVELDQLFYCTNEDEFIGWSQWKRAIHVLTADLEPLSTFMCDYNIGNLAYNEMTSDVFTCGRGSVTVWQFRYNRKHLLPKFECHDELKADLEYNLIAAEQSNGALQRLFITSGYDVLTFNIADEGRIHSIKQDLHVRPIVAILFVDQREVLVTAGRDGSIKVWDHRWFILYAYVGHHDRILTLSKHPFGPYVISTSQDRTVRVWSLEHGDVVDVLKVSEPITNVNVTRNYEKFLMMSSKCLQLWCIKHYCDFLTYVGSPILKITCTTHPDYPTRAALLCKDSTVRIVAATTGDVLTSLVCDLNYKISSCAYAVGENILFATNGTTLIKADTSVNPSRVIQQFEVNDCSLFNDFDWLPFRFHNSNCCRLDTIQCLMIYEYVAKSQMEETPMLKSLVTKPSSDLIHLALKGFSRTLLIAGLSNGCVAVLRWNTAEIDYSMEMHSERPVVDMIAHPSADQMISCGADLIIRIWRVYPYATESLAVVRSIFCALAPIHLTIVKNSLAVAFRDEPTLTHSLMVYNLENNERFDHLPANDHCDKITAISGCSRLKLIATGSLDGTLRIWNGKNQLIRMVIIHDAINSLHFSNDSGDLVVGIGDHLYKMSHLSYLPKMIVFKTISMQFQPPLVETKESEEIDQSQLTRMGSADLIRWKRAHRAEELPTDIIPENAAVTAYHAHAVEEMKAKTEAMEKLEKRDLEIAQIAEGKLQRTKKYKIGSKVRKEAFNEYMKMFLKERKKGLLEDDLYKLTEEDLFGPPPRKPDPYVIETDENGFFPSLKEANPDPLSKVYQERENTLTKLDEHYRSQPPFATDDIRAIKQHQDKYELKKLLNANLEKITLPDTRPRYGPGAIVPNSVLAKLLWPNRQPKTPVREEWLPPALSTDQLKAMEKEQPPIISEEDNLEREMTSESETPTFRSTDEEAAWKELMEETMKKKLDIDEDAEVDPFKKLKKDQSGFMKQLSDLAKQTPEPTPLPPEPIEEEVTRPEGQGTPGTSKPPSRIARPTPLRNPPVVKPPPPPKVARIPVAPLTKISDEATQTVPVEVHVKTPRQFNASFMRLIEKLKDLKWFEEQYPLVKLDIFLETCDESTFPFDVIQRLDFVQNPSHRIIILKELEAFFRSQTMDDTTRDTLIDKVLFHLMKYDPANISLDDMPSIEIFFRMVVETNQMTMDVVAEFIYWYLDGTDRIKSMMKNIFTHCGLDDPLGYFYNEMESWKLWELDSTQPRRSGIKALAYEWLRQWTRSFRTHIEEMFIRLKSGDIHVQISNATSRALTGDVGLSSKSSSNGKNVTVTLDNLPRTATKNISAIEVINYFVEMTQEQINERNQQKEKPEDNTILVLPKINKPTALVRLGESHTVFHRPVRRHPLLIPPEHRFEPGESMMGRCVNYPVRKILLDPFRRQIFTEDIEFSDTEPYLLTLKLAPKFFLPTLSQVTKI